MLFLLLVAGLNVCGIHLVGKVTLFLLLTMSVPIAIFVWMGFHHAHFNPFHPFFPTDRPWQGAFGVGLAIALWSYSGYEQLSTVIEEVENPARNFPIGLAIVVPLAIGIYVVTLAAGLAAIGQLARMGDRLSRNCCATGGRERSRHRDVCRGGDLQFCAAGKHFALGHSHSLTMAEDGYFHPALAKVSARFGTPVRSILLSTAFCAALAVFTVPQLIGVYAWTRMATSIQTVLSFWQLRRKYPDAPRSFRVSGGVSRSAAGGARAHAAICLGDDLQRRRHAQVGTAEPGFGPLAYLWIRYRRKSQRQPAAAPAELTSVHSGERSLGFGKFPFLFGFPAVIR